VGDPAPTTRTWSVSKAIGATSTSQLGNFTTDPITAGKALTVDWDLTTDMLPSPAGTTWPSLPGAHFQMTLTPYVNGNETFYLLTNPSIVYPNETANATDLTLFSIMVKVNGQAVINETTFAYVTASAYANTTTPISVGAMEAVTDIRTSDVISVSFGTMATANLPPPPPAPSVSFTTTGVTLPKPNRSNPAVAESATLQLNQQIDNFVTVTYTVSGTAVPPTATTKVPNMAGTMDTVPSNLIDYQFTNQDVAVANNAITGEIVFVPNTTSATIDLSVLPNDRYENNGNGTTIVLTITNVNLGNGNSGNITPHPSYTVNIQETNSAPAVGQVTLQSLLSSGGAFYQNCVECHHAVNGVPLNQYSMMDFTSLMSNNHFVANDPNDSIAWERITGVITPQMPANGLLSQGAAGQQYYNDIYNWIMNGCLNN
jgi:hypothetical protein